VKITTPLRTFWLVNKTSDNKHEWRGRWTLKAAEDQWAKGIECVQEITVQH
jgi:hypothetical protein